MPESESIRKPLSGIRVLEMGQLIAGPFAGQLLAYYGAEVVKIEPPAKGDPLRSWRILDEQGTSYWWTSIARNKKSLTINLAEEAGQQLASQLINSTDVLIENFRPGKMESWNLGPKQFEQSNPGLVYTRVSGYGQDGPYAPKPGYASVCEGVAGMRYVNGFPGEAPVRANLSLGDSFAGMHAAMGVLLALFNRQTDQGRGQTIDVSIVESVFNLMEGVAAEFSGAGVVREPSGTTVTGIVPTNTYPCADGKHIVIGGNGDSIFKRLMIAVGQPDMAQDPELANNAGRVRHEKAIDEVLAEWTAKHASDDALQLLENAQVPAGPINSIADIVSDPHFQAREAFETVEVNGQRRTIPAVHPKLSRTPGATDWGGPMLGQHTDEVLNDWLSMDEATIASLRSNHII
jgi:crotonobetainyl-CoA:carnitine CoA-transferase CaiB-like acyl-CoA transferase